MITHYHTDFGREVVVECSVDDRLRRGVGGAGEKERFMIACLVPLNLSARSRGGLCRRAQHQQFDFNCLFYTLELVLNHEKWHRKGLLRCHCIWSSRTTLLLLHPSNPCNSLPTGDPISSSTSTRQWRLRPKSLHLHYGLACLLNITPSKDKCTTGYATAVYLTSLDYIRTPHDWHMRYSAGTESSLGPRV